MKRYTKIDKHGHYYVNAPIYDRGLTCDDKGGWLKSSEISAYDGLPIDRLAEYENIGLTPNEIVKRLNMGG